MVKELPFELEKETSFFHQLSGWVGDQFYDVFPEHGLEIRDEQVYMAYQLEKGFANKEIIMAEAGVGTGKTLVYLLYSLCYARYKGKPGIVTCADETLIEQLVKNEGDIKKLNNILGLNIDVRLAKSEDQYLCLKKLFNLIAEEDDTDLNQIYDGLPPFVFDDSGIVQYKPYGDRKDYSNLSNEVWERINWDVFQDCFSCEQRHRCGQTLSRDYYRKSKDLIVCSHDFFMKHLWTEEARKREGQLPYLPSYSSVVFDEGHLLEFAAQKALTYTLKEGRITNLLTRLSGNDIRSELAYLIEAALSTSEDLFDAIYEVLGDVDFDQAERIYVDKDERWLKYIRSLQNVMAKIGDALVFESELYTVEEYELNIMNEYLDELEYAFELLLNENVIYWAEMKDGSMQIVVMPHLIQDFMKEHVWSKRIPYVFSSATLSNEGDFSYLCKRLGIEQSSHFSVDSPYEYEDRMEVIFNINEDNQKSSKVLERLKETNGRTLILFPSRKELLKFKLEVGTLSHPFEILYEGDQEISSIVSYFQNHEHTVLCAVHLWEGLDVPGSSLSQVIIWDLPFPPSDPVFNSFRNASSSPFEEVDLPYMLLRVRQGIGRLIRTHEDRGDIVILFNQDSYNQHGEFVTGILPVKPKIIHG